MIKMIECIIYVATHQRKVKFSDGCLNERDFFKEKQFNKREEEKNKLISDTGRSIIFQTEPILPLFHQIKICISFSQNADSYAPFIALIFHPFAYRQVR
jgi:hypothetical protein